MILPSFHPHASTSFGASTSSLSQPSHSPFPLPTASRQYHETVSIHQSLTGEQKHGPEKRGPRRREGWDVWRGKRWCPWFPWNRPLAGQCAEGGRQCRPRRQQVPPTLAPVSSAANQTLVLDTPPRSPLVPPLAAVVAAGEGMSHALDGPALPLRDPPFISALAAMEH